MIHTLRRNQPITTAPGTLTCLEGALWITWEGSEDVMLAKGGSIDIPRGSHPVVEAIGGPAALETEAAPGPGFLRIPRPAMRGSP